MRKKYYEKRYTCVISNISALFIIEINIFSFCDNDATSKVSFIHTSRVSFFAIFPLSKMLFPIFKKVICFYSLEAFPRRFHSSVPVRLMATSSNSLFSFVQKRLSPPVCFLFKIRAFDTVRMSYTARLYSVPLLIRGFISSIRFADTYIHISVFKILISLGQVTFGAI